MWCLVEAIYKIEVEQMKIPAMMMDFFFSWISQMILNPCISTRSMRKQDMRNLVRHWLARLNISPFFPQTLQEFGIDSSGQRDAKSLSSDGILPYKLYKGSVLFLWSCGSRLMMEWALLPHRDEEITGAGSWCSVSHVWPWIVLHLNIWPRCFYTLGMGFQSLSCP